MAFSPDGTLLATASHDGTARIWDLATGTTRTTLQGHTGTRGVAFSPDGTLLATASDDGTARIWDLATGIPPAPPCKATRRPERVAFSPDGALLATASTTTPPGSGTSPPAPSAPPCKATQACSGAWRSPPTAPCSPPPPTTTPPGSGTWPPAPSAPPCRPIRRP